jgi:hypothetical protein
LRVKTRQPVSGCPKPHINGEYPMGKEMEAA